MFRPEYTTEFVRLLGRWPPDIFLSSERPIAAGSEVWHPSGGEFVLQ